MDFNLKQWRDDSDAQHPDSAAKLPGLELLSSHPHQQPSAAALPLFVPESTTPAATKFPFSGMESCYFSMSQWQELELQALIFRHMTTGAPVPPELLHLVKKSLISSSPNPSHYFYPHHYNSSLGSAVAQSGYWGRTAGMDPEPGRCRRTDGKKWRCSRDVVAGQKYCERHMHRGRNRSRKPVELHASAGSPYATGNAVKSSHSISRPSAGAGDPSANFIHFNQRPGETGGGPFEAQKLRHFFNEWPKTVDEAATNLTISMPGNMASDFSLKLGYSNGEERDKPQVSWGMGWESNSGPAMGGPLAEALRLSTTGSSPTSVLHLVPRGQGSEASYGSS